MIFETFHRWKFLEFKVSSMFKTFFLVLEFLVAEILAIEVKFEAEWCVQNDL